MNEELCKHGIPENIGCMICSNTKVKFLFDEHQIFLHKINDLEANLERQLHINVQINERLMKVEESIYKEFTQLIRLAKINEVHEDRIQKACDHVLGINYPYVELVRLSTKNNYKLDIEYYTEFKFCPECGYKLIDE